MKRMLFFLFSFLCCLSLNADQKSPGLLIKIPTRSRPEQLFNMLDKYYSLLSGEVRYLFLISCDSDDQTMNQERCRQKLNQYPNLVVRFSSNHSKIEAYNKNIDEFISNWDVILVTSDDMEPVMQGYDKVIMQTMQEQFPNFDGVLNFNDGFLDDVLNTYPIIGKNFYQRFGYIYHPDYLSLACDLELTVVSRMLKKEFVSAQVLIKHNHPGNGIGTWDPLYVQNEALLPVDKKTFFHRRVNHFYLSEEELERVCTKDLTIIIGSTRGHFDKIAHFKNRLTFQINKNQAAHRVELLCCEPVEDFSAEVNKQLRLSNGIYVVFIDVEMNITNDYVMQILNACKTKPQIISVSIATHRGNIVRQQSIKTSPVKVNFLNPVKRYLALQFNSPDNRWGSRPNWAQHLIETNVLTHEKSLARPLYLMN